jgi:hypothetical protein
MESIIVTEQWRSISGYINYQVSNLGRVRNASTGKILKEGNMKSGYKNIVLCKEGKTRTHFVHRLVASEFLENTENKAYVDHVDHDKSNNCVSNLRWATPAENHMNMHQKRTNVSSQYKGVYWSKQKNKWHASIRLDGKVKHLGFYDEEQDAAQAYNAKALELFGEYAHVNVIEV